MLEWSASRGHQRTLMARATTRVTRASETIASAMSHSLDQCRTATASLAPKPVDVQNESHK